MENLINIAVMNLVSPPILFFLLGTIAARLKSDLDISAGLGKTLSLYLMLAIGFKGGVELSRSELSPTTAIALLAAALLSFALPFIAYAFLRLTTRMDRINAGAIGAHYGSISLVTFVAGTAFLETHAEYFEGFLIVMMVLMEAPAMISGLFLARRGLAGAPDKRKPLLSPKLLREVLFGWTIFLLLGSLFIGFLTGERGMAAMAGFISLPFIGFLCLFMLEMGLVAGRRLEELKKFGLPLILFGFYMPLVGASLGILAGLVIGLSQGGTALLAILCASASYIVVPAALRHALPQANPSISVPLVLGVTFPFNILLGIPLYYHAAKVGWFLVRGG